MSGELFTPVAANVASAIDNKCIYNNLLSKALYARAVSRGYIDGSSFCDQIDNLYNNIVAYLSSTDFYTAPASSKYHDVFEGGLVFHNLQVYNQILELSKVFKFRNIDIGSAVFVALVHDWCKISTYVKYQKNMKNPATGEWEAIDAYRVNDGSTGRLGHGPQSVVMAMRLCNTQYTALTDEEIAAIRWHSYTYDVTSYDIYALNDCNRNIPLVHMLQFADQLAITNY